MVRSGFETGALGWKAQTHPPGYGLNLFILFFNANF